MEGGGIKMADLDIYLRGLFWGDCGCHIGGLSPNQKALG